MKKSFSPQSVSPDATASVDTPTASLPRVIRMPGLRQMYPVARTTIYELIKAGKLPRPIALSKRARGWVLADVEECIAKLKAEANHG
ncbi:AlpA family transcriptional regulator [Paraburkholderia sp. GV068]|uniref:helix-turn-helix transcriptional regulator n=1 Tax=unclassified Paraburkholderia TaxID=2615204 RepID=UPI000D30838F|nr:MULTISPECIES: AlpA family phage regulatory protein [unclassified Paraburkholderia]PTR03788.1 AlpA family transcriptional regulator [Paraburkholderia sp. GV072]PUB08746.1 AlpA family transcriptional regulator [Paraburkholderia sp. GV068]